MQTHPIETPITPPATSPATGYHPLTKALHWLTFTLLAAQFAVGYLMDDDSGQGRGRGRGRGGESGQGRGRGRGGDLDLSDNTLLRLHVIIGVTIVAVAVIRLVWRRRSDLPPWAPTLSGFERKLAHRTEQALYACLFAIPLTGLWLVLVSDDAVGFHVATHVVFFVALAAHVGLVLKHQLLQRDRLLRRML